MKKLFEKIKELKKKRAFRIFLISIKIFIAIMLIGFILSVCLQRFSGNKISIFNYRLFTVITGSMKPKYDKGDVLVSKVIDPSTIKVGDDITYLGNRGSFNGKVVTHRVVGITKAENGKYYFRTKGLANLVEDPMVSQNQLYGKIIYKAWLLSIIYKIVATKIGFYLFVIIPIMYVIGAEMVTALLKKEQKRREELK